MFPSMVRGKEMSNQRMLKDFGYTVFLFEFVQSDNGRMTTHSTHLDCFLEIRNVAKQRTREKEREREEGRDLHNMTHLSNLRHFITSFRVGILT